MSKVGVTWKVPRNYNAERMEELFRQLEEQINALSEGKITARYTSRSATPTGTGFAKGDFVINSEPAELGTTGGKYVVGGWICTSSGGQFVEARWLTGN